MIINFINVQLKKTVSLAN